ncbi:nitroreductase/quinone reductase family protein [Streptomyces sp. Je 1-79]|uniref:nitroreductase/quinone reductase family protein n=1 Tax=Streptomyces sp. Je 1-79 TaxID=2943847 RepID=UPI0021A37D68|nr:nitroreductase/quinone reductase family protein [Streptomyces sp. Je 1-79]MCT4354328.1 nitroreductase/quinone reductase family protein [Streptomyces sp. Je 1-79]
MPLHFNARIIDEFRTTAGRLGGPFEGWVLLLLTTTGARSGAPHTTPLGFVPDGERILVVGSAGGSDRHPDWYRNILVNPTVTVETGTDTWQATAVAATGAERDELFAKVVADAPGYADYQRATDRILPVVALHRIPEDTYTPPDRLDALADELVKIHDWLRAELVSLREGIGARTATGAPDLTVELRRHCLTFCSAMAVHHGGEDAGLFPYLAREFPEKAGTFERLHAEHGTVARILDELTGLLARLDEIAPEQVRAEFDRLHTELVEHFAYEEEQVVPLLRTLAT